jgi:FAD/FMN-containing dehydrogenase
LEEGNAMASWTNWSGKQRSKPQALHFVRSEADAQAIVAAAANAGQSIRVAGAGHSHAPLVINNGVIVDASGLAGVVSVDVATKRAWVWAGTRIYALGRPLHDQGLALKNQGDIDRQAIAGAVATGTHGTGITLQNLSASVTGLRIVTASGDLVECNAEHNAELFRASRLNLGAFGLVTQLQLQLTDAYRLQEQGWSEPFEPLMEKLDALVADARHFEFFWYPHTDVAVTKSTALTTAPPEYPLAAEGSRRAWSHEVLSNHRPLLHTEMEYSVPATDGPACVRAIRELILKDFAGLKWPVEYRTLAADDVWLSTAYERPTVTISVHQDANEDDAPYFRACEDIFKAFAGRPHWGKIQYLDGAALAARHPRWSDWWKARDAVDPAQLFLNDYLLTVRPARA